MDVEVLDGEGDMVDAVSLRLRHTGMQVVVEEVGDALDVLREACGQGVLGASLVLEARCGLQEAGQDKDRRQSLLML